MHDGKRLETQADRAGLQRLSGELGRGLVQEVPFAARGLRLGNGEQPKAEQYNGYFFHK
jgi:hypothetical protein